MQPISISTPYIVLWTILGILLQYADSEPQVPCFFVFGDSLSDNGNNNDLPTKAKVDYPPYGVDFPGRKPTGRFSNGLNIIDVIGVHLGLNESVPPFASIGNRSGEELIKGVNYASGSAGIRAETGVHLGARIPIDQQLLNHGIIIARIALRLRDDTFEHLNKCLYTINVGSNDYLNNYFLPEKNYVTSKVYKNLDLYAKVLIQQYSQQIQALYTMGARKVALFKLGPIGCTPQAITKFGFLGLLCSTKMNLAAMHFNVRLQNLVDSLNKKLKGANITCINMDEIFLTSWPGFLHITKPCCKVRPDGQCQNDSVPCLSRKRYVFYDNFHPTEAFNVRTGGRAYKAATPLDAHPVDICTLVGSS